MAGYVLNTQINRKHVATIVTFDIRRGNHEFSRRMFNVTSQTSIYMDCALILLLDIRAELTDSLK